MECFPPTLSRESVQMYARGDRRRVNLRKRSVRSRSGKEKRCQPKKMRSSDGGRIGSKVNREKKKSKVKSLSPRMQKAPPIQNLWSSSEEYPELGLHEANSMSPLPLSISSFPLETNQTNDTTQSPDTSTSFPYFLTSSSSISTPTTLTSTPTSSISTKCEDIGVDENSFCLMNASVDLSKIPTQQNFSMDDAVELDQSIFQQGTSCIPQSKHHQQQAISAPIQAETSPSISPSISPSAPPPLEDPYTMSPRLLSSPPSSPLISPQRDIDLEFPSLPPEVDYLPLDLSGADDWLESIFT